MEELHPKEELGEEAMKKYYASFLRAGELVEEAIAEGSIGKRDVLLDVSVVQAAVWGIVAQFRSKRVHPNYWGSIDPLIERLIEVYFGGKGDSK